MISFQLFIILLEVRELKSKDALVVLSCVILVVFTLSLADIMDMDLHRGILNRSSIIKNNELSMQVLSSKDSSIGKVYILVDSNSNEYIAVEDGESFTLSIRLDKNGHSISSQQENLEYDKFLISISVGEDIADGMRYTLRDEEEGVSYRLTKTGGVLSIANGL